MEERQAGDGKADSSSNFGVLAKMSRIFIIEGLATIAFAILAFFIIADWPEDAKFLTAEEKALIADRLASDGKSGVARMDTLNKDALKRIFRDWKIWCG